MRTAAVVLLVVGLSILGGSAQEHPSFAGTWTLASDRSTYVGDDGNRFTVYVFNQLFSVRQTPETLTITMEPLPGGPRPNDDCGLKIVYRLDGEPTENCMGADHQRTQSTATWSGTTLLLTTTGAVERNGTSEPWHLRFTLAFNEDGTLRAEAPWGHDHAMIGSVYNRVE